MKKRYAVCGVSSRALAMYIGPMVKNFSHVAEFVGMLGVGVDTVVLVESIEEDRVSGHHENIGRKETQIFLVIALKYGGDQ